MKELIIASGNKYKISEIRQLTASLKIDVISMSAAGIHDDIEETGISLEQNSWIKAAYIFDKLGKNTLSEDTGLEVKSLQNAPGIYSARYAGKQNNVEDNISLLLANLKNHHDRRARFRTVISLIWQEQVFQFVGTVQGNIIHEKVGNDGFGYDPIFMPFDYKITFAQMSKDEKNRISHRGIAIRKVINFIESRYKSLK